MLIFSDDIMRIRIDNRDPVIVIFLLKKAVDSDAGEPTIPPNNRTLPGRRYSDAGLLSPGLLSPGRSLISSTFMIKMSRNPSWAKTSREMISPHRYFGDF